MSVYTSSPIWGTKGDFLGMTSVIQGEGLNSLDTSLLMDGLALGRWSHTNMDNVKIANMSPFEMKSEVWVMTDQ